MGDVLLEVIDWADEPVLLGIEILADLGCAEKLLLVVAGHEADVARCSDSENLTEGISRRGDVKRDDLIFGAEPKRAFEAVEDDDVKALKNIPMLGQPSHHFRTLGDILGNFVKIFHTNGK
jgi:hypothetical protein